MDNVSGKAWSKDELVFPVKKMYFDLLAFGMRILQTQVTVQD